MAIAERRAAEDALAKLDGASDRLHDKRYAADEAVAAAADALEMAKGAASQHVLASAIGEAGDAPQTVKAARAALLEAEDALEAARAASDGLSGRTEAARNDVARTADRAKTAAMVVLLGSPAIAAVAETMLRAQRELADAGAAFTWLHNAGAFPRHEVHGTSFGKPADPALRAAMSRYYLPPSYWNELLQAMPGAKAWEAALAALQTDANAAIPGEPA